MSAPCPVLDTLSKEASLRAQALQLEATLFDLIKDDRGLLEVMASKGMSDLDYRTVVIVAALGKTRYSVELYHRRELALTRFDMMKKVHTRAKALRLGLNVVAPENYQIHVDALLVPQRTWVFGTVSGKGSVARLPPDRLFPNAFMMQDLELTYYSKSFALSTESNTK